MTTEFKLNSFFMGGFECADQINRSGVRINLRIETEHDTRVLEDYQLLSGLNIKVVREGICWSTVEIAPYTYDFSSLAPLFEAAEQEHIQIIWDLCHFGYPDGLIPTHPQFVSRFTSLCMNFSEYHKYKCTGQLLIVPINEISFLSWHSGDMRGTVPFAINSGDDIKYHLCKAAIEGMKVLREESPDCIIFAVEPLIKIHAADDSIAQEDLRTLNENQFKAMDVLLGRALPELGGQLDLVDMLGFNYYYNNQWNHKNEPHHWPNLERERTPFSELLLQAYSRYKKPVLVTETGHFGYGRDQWIMEITKECLLAKSRGVDLRGICIYPIIDRPDWDDLHDYSKCGIWDLDEDKNRTPDTNYLEACKESIELTNAFLNGKALKF